jgi:hypothetical protein
MMPLRLRIWLLRFRIDLLDGLIADRLRQVRAARSERERYLAKIEELRQIEDRRRTRRVLAELLERKALEHRLGQLEDVQ